LPWRMAPSLILGADGGTRTLKGTDFKSACCASSQLPHIHNWLAL